MKVGCFGAGAWGFCLANLLASNGHEVLLWARNKELLATLAKTNEHPKFPGFKCSSNLKVCADFAEVFNKSDICLESVTTSGIRSLMEAIKKINPIIGKPLILTSKGIEQKTDLLVDEIVVDCLGSESEKFLCCLSGPSIAKEVMKKLPTTCVYSAYDEAQLNKVGALFNNDFFRVYPNLDFKGAEFGGAMKNIIAIACGISDGLGFESNTKSAIMTRGLHEMRKLSPAKKANPETLNGLAGLGDMCTTCLSPHSRNYRFGRLLAEGLSPDAAKEKIGMVVEGAGTCAAALELGKRHKIALPITEAIYSIVYQGLSPKEAVKKLLSREIKKEHL